MSDPRLITEAHALLALRIFITAIVLTILCGLVLGVPELRSFWRLWREKRAVARRKKREELMTWLAYRRRVRVERSAADAIRERQQFSIPAAFRDAKGVRRL